MRLTKTNVILGIVGVLLLLAAIMCIALDIDTGIMSGLDIGPVLFIVGLIVTIIGFVKYIMAPSKTS